METLDGVRKEVQRLYERVSDYNNEIDRCDIAGRLILLVAVLDDIIGIREE